MNTLVDGYVKVKDMRHIMVSGYLKWRCLESYLDLFREMERVGILVDVKVMVNIATVYGRLGLIKYGRSMHGYFVRRFWEKNNMIFVNEWIS